MMQPHKNAMPELKKACQMLQVFLGSTKATQRKWHEEEEKKEGELKKASQLLPEQDHKYTL